MKAKIVNPTTPTLAAGQLWKNPSGQVYLAVTIGMGKPIMLLNTSSFRTVWSLDDAFGDEKFTYVGNLEIVE